jgi:hypothetical protein
VNKGQREGRGEKPRPCGTTHTCSRVALDVPAWREPHPQLAVAVQEHLPLKDHKDRDREVPASLFGAHMGQGYTRVPVR